MQTMRRFLALGLIVSLALGAAADFDILDFLPAILGRGYTLSVSVMPPEGGTVNISPSQTCYQPGAQVGLYAIAAPGFGFALWSGDLSGTASSTTVTMDKNKTIKAVFDKAPILQTPVVSDTQITLTWTFAGWPLFGATGEGYRLEESTSSALGPFQEIAQIPGRATPKSYSFLRNPGTYYYRVRVFLNQGPRPMSPYSNVVWATVGTQPRRITLINNVGSQKLDQVVQVKVAPPGIQYSKNNDLLFPDTPSCWDLPGDVVERGQSRVFDISLTPPYNLFIGMGIWEADFHHCLPSIPWFKRRQLTTTGWDYYFVWVEANITAHTGNWTWTITGSYTAGNLRVIPEGNPAIFFTFTTGDPIP